MSLSQKIVKWLFKKRIEQKNWKRKIQFAETALSK